MLYFKLRDGGSIPSPPAEFCARHTYSTLGEWCSGSTLDSKPIDGGSIPSFPAEMVAQLEYSQVVRQRSLEPPSEGSIPSTPILLGPVTQW